jgi:hypothetical protein
VIDNIAAPRNQDVITNFNTAGASKERASYESVTTNNNTSPLTLAHQVTLHYTALANLDPASRTVPHGPEVDPSRSVDRNSSAAHKLFPHQELENPIYQFTHQSLAFIDWDLQNLIQEAPVEF